MGTNTSRAESRAKAEEKYKFICDTLEKVRMEIFHQELIIQQYINSLGENEREADEDELQTDPVEQNERGTKEETRSRLEGRSMELEPPMEKAKLIDRKRTDVVSPGSIIYLRTSEGRKYRYTLVGAFEANPSAGRISKESPVGKALLGHKSGDCVIVTTPGGVKEYTILSIE